MYNQDIETRGYHVRQDDHPTVKTFHEKYAAAKAADAAYSAAIVAAGFKSRWTLDSAARAHPDVARAFAAKVLADNESLKWQRLSFVVCHPDIAVE
jgi:hypothetical protein